MTLLTYFQERVSHLAVPRTTGVVTDTARSIRVLVCLCLVALPSLSHAQSVSPSVTPSVPGLRYTPKGEIVVPMIFPVLGSCRWSDTWGAPRGGGTRKHQGQDLPAPKMRPLLACFDGVWTGGGIRGDNGCYASYLHINNDTPGTDDGRGGSEFAYAPGVWPGARVKAGQHVAYCGDSGNAEDTISHLHFELSVPGAGTVNAAASLRVATHLKTARYPLPEAADVSPQAGELRLDGEVLQVDTARGVLQMRVAAWSNAKGKVTPQTRPVRRWLKLPDASASPGLSSIEVGDFVAGSGKDPGKGTIAARGVTLLRTNDWSRRTRLANANRAAGLNGGGRTGLFPSPQQNGSAPTFAPSVPPVTTLADFETAAYEGWTLSGNCWGRGPEGMAFAGNVLTGWGGRGFATSAHGKGVTGDFASGTGTAISGPFLIPADAVGVRFRIAGGRYPEKCCLNLLLDGKVVRSASGESPYQMQTLVWDVTDLRGKQVHLEIRDDVALGAHAFVHVDDIVLLRVPSR